MNAQRCELLITAFIRSIEECLKNQAIPQELKALCFNYLYSQSVIIALHSSFIRCGDIENNEHWKYKVIQTKNCATLPDIKMENAAVCYVNNIKLPSLIRNQFTETMQFHTPRAEYNVLFHSNRYFTGNPISWTLENVHKTFCRAYIINPAMAHTPNIDQMVIYETKLPSLSPEIIRANDLIFCDKTQTLISIGGIIGIDHRYEGSSLVYGLSFDDKDAFEWKLMPHLHHKRSSSSSVFVDSGSRLMVIGGQGPDFGIALNYVEMYDNVEEEWKILSAVNHERMANGVCYDETSQRVHIVGGFDGKDYGGVRTVEFYDLNSNKWYKELPDIGDNHDYYPATWIQDRNILSVASITSKTIEAIDLRENTKKWEVKQQEDDFDNIIGQELDSSDAAKYRLFVDNS